jgi:hypothetical protein
MALMKYFETHDSSSVVFRFEPTQTDMLEKLDILIPAFAKADGIATSDIAPLTPIFSDDYMTTVENTLAFALISALRDGILPLFYRNVLTWEKGMPIDSNAPPQFDTPVVHVQYTPRFVSMYQFDFKGEPRYYAGLTFDCVCTMHVPESDRAFQFEITTEELPESASVFRPEVDSDEHVYNAILREAYTSIGVNAFKIFSEKDDVDLEQRSIASDVISGMFFARFKLTQGSLAHFRNEGMPEELIERLHPIVDQQIEGETGFWSAIRAQIGREQEVQYETLIRRYVAFEF